MRRLAFLLVRPGPTLDELVQLEPARGRLAMLLVGGVWALFSAALAFGGEAPSVTLVPIPKAHYYAAQALFAVPLFWLLWGVLTQVAHRLATAFGGSVDGRSGAAAMLGHAYAAPMIALFLVPDILVYGVFGHAGLARFMKFYAPLGPLVALALGSAGLARAYGLGRGRAFVTALCAFLAQALVGAPLLR
jgi:hypothetical protein